MNKSHNSGSKSLISARNISISLFRLDSGNVQLESHLLDPFHLIRLTIEIDPESRTILVSEAEMANFPHEICPRVLSKARNIAGLKIARGIMKELAGRLGGSTGCVHLRELAMETVNFAATALTSFGKEYGLMSRELGLIPDEERRQILQESLKDTCHVYKR
ncbi:DUF2889 domain-containing protein [bacterium]|nr:DUF2889 domain-containing protein [bacterium]